MDRGLALFDGQTRDYNHATDDNYKKLRAQADELYQKRNKLSQQSQQAYKNGDGSKAHELSEELKKVLRQAEEYNHKAAEYVFRENNTDSAEDEIDLHGLYVKEAEYFLQNRIAHDIRTNQSHLKVIVGKGLHSAGGVAKIKPAVDQMCTDCNLKHRIDPKNAGVLVIDLTNTNQSQVPSHWNNTISQPQQAYHGNSGPQYQNHQQQQPHYQQQQQHNQSGLNANNFKTGNQLVDGIVKLLCMCLNNKN